MLLAAIVLASLPGVAVAAPGGSITDVRPTGSGGLVTATYTSTFDVCTESGYCGWFPYANEVPASQPCREDDNTLTYVGDLEDGSGTQVGTDTFTPTYTPTKICLYATQAGADYLLAEYVYPQATPTPTPTATPGPTTQGGIDDDDEVRPMTIAEGRSLLPDVLRTRYGSRFARSTMTRSCSRLTTEKVRCRVAWRKSPFRYRGTVTLWNDPDDAESFVYRTSIKRTRIKTAKPKAPQRAADPAPAAPSCNPNYSGACLPLSGDVDCGEISARDFRSTGSDPFRLDGDDDGIACES